MPLVRAILRRMPAQYEEILALLLAQLSEPIQQYDDGEGGIVMRSGKPEEVVVRLTDEAVLIAEFALDMSEGNSVNVTPLPIGSVHWAAISQDAAVRAIRTLLAAARESRLAKFRTCAICGEAVPPEWMEDDTVCGACTPPGAGTIH